MFSRILEREWDRLGARWRISVGWSKPGQALGDIKMEVRSGAVPRVVAQCDHLSLSHSITIRDEGGVMCQVIIASHGSIRMLNPDQVLMAEDVVSFQETHLQIHNLSASAGDDPSAGWHGKID